MHGANVIVSPDSSKRALLADNQPNKSRVLSEKLRHKIKAPAYWPAPSLVAGAGFEPATFGL